MRTRRPHLPRAEVARLTQGMDPRTQRLCVSCRTVKSTLAFGILNSAWDGSRLKYACRLCRRHPTTRIEVTSKQCKKCGISKPITSFYVRRDLPDGRQHTCKDCSASTQRDAYARNKQRDDRLPLKYRYCTSCQRTLSTTEFYPARHTRDGLMTACKTCCLKDQSTLERKARASALSARLASAAYWTYTEEQIEASVAHRIAIANDPCWYCGARTENLAWSHPMPAPRGGPDIPENIRHACVSCIGKKRSRCEQCYLAGNPICPPTHRWGDPCPACLHPAVVDGYCQRCMWNYRNCNG